MDFIGAGVFCRRPRVRTDSAEHCEGRGLWGCEEPTGVLAYAAPPSCGARSPPFLPRKQLLELTWNGACEPLSFRAWATVLHTSPLPSTSLRMSRVSVAGLTRICEGSTTMKGARFDDDRAIIPSVSWTLRGQNKS